jgi:hypothetical protein
MTTPRIFYFCFSHNRPRGGNKHSYRHVDILNGAGLWAAALHVDPGFTRYEWFENDTRVVNLAEFHRTYRLGEDIVVVPEDLRPQTAAFAGRKVIFNKNVYYGALSLGLKDPLVDPYLDPDVEAAFAVSEHNASYLRMAYPDLPVFRLYPEIDASLFQFRNLAEKKPLIATNGKAQGDVMAVFHLLRARSQQGLNCLPDFEWAFLNDVPQGKVAATLADALFFVFLSTTEGFGRMPVEAMSCGAVPVAYSAGPGDEFLPSACRFRVGDLEGIVDFIEKHAMDFRSSSELQRLTAHGRALARNFSLERQRSEVLRVWHELLAGGRPRRKPAQPQRLRMVDVGR